MQTKLSSDCGHGEAIKSIFLHSVVAAGHITDAILDALFGTTTLPSQQGCQIIYFQTKIGI
jgi:hypothetical protein